MIRPTNLRLAPSFLRTVLSCLAGLGLLLTPTACSSFGLPPTAYIPGSPRAEDFPDIGAAILEDVATLTYRSMDLPEGQGRRVVAVLDHRRRIKILQASGLQAARVTLPIDGFTTISKVVARSVDPDGTEHTMGQSAVQAVVRPNPEQRAPDVKLLAFEIPSPSVGGLLEYRYEQFFTDAFLVPPYVFGDAMPVLRSEFGLVVDDSLKVDYRYGHGDTLLDQPPLRRDSVSGVDRLVFVETDLPPYYEEPMMPHITRSAPWIAVALREEQQGSTVRRAQNWADVAVLAQERMFEVHNPPRKGSLVQRYHGLTAALSPLRLGGLGVRPPQSARDLNQGAPACSRDAAAMLLGAFGGADVEAAAAFITNPLSPQAFKDFPALYPFEQAAVAIRITEDLLVGQSCGPDPLSHSPLCGYQPGDYLFVDPLCKTCALGVLPPHLMGGRALVAAAKSAQWVDMPLDPPQRHLQRLLLRVTLDVDGTLAGTLDAELRGTQAAALRDSLATASGAPGRRETLLGAQLLGTAPRGPNITGARLGDLTNLEASVKVQAHLTAQASRQDYEHFRLSLTEITGPSLPPAWRSTRRTTALLDGPRWHETRAEIQLPLGYETRLPEPFRAVHPAAEYAASFTLKDRTLVLNRRLVIKAHAVSPEQWQSFQTFLADVQSFEQTGPQVWSPAT